jgi:hypothetical protein
MIKKLFFTLATILFTQTLFAQAPEGINYQAVIRNGNGTLVTSTTVAIRIQIKQTSATGTIVYQERHSVLTSSQGLVNLVIGSGVVQSGVFASINWGTGPYFISLGVDFANGTNYQDFGTQQLMSVPFALYAKTAGNQLNQWRYGNGAPATTLGAFGDFYLDVTNGNVYYKNTGSAWILTGNITGPQGVAGAVGLQGVQGPAGPQGATGATGLTGPAGPQGATGPAGPQGVTGATGLQGPAGAAGPQGPIGLTGPAGATGTAGPQGPAGTNGTNGNTILSGTSNPTAGIGVNGDYYMNTTTNTFFGPKANGAWPAGFSMVGPQGPAGPQGLIGATGATGAVGPQGATGATGSQGPIGLTGPVGATGPQGPIGLTGATGAQGTAGTNGTNGLSAYQIAVNNGFVGTEAQWLTSLQGPIGLTGAQGTAGTAGTNGTNGLSAYQIAVNNGFVGTEAQWLTSLQGPIGLTGAQGTAGTNGTNGLSAYQIAVNNGFVGTEAQWLTSLQGPIGLTGATGATGPQGATGVTGSQGPIGLTGPAGSQGPQGTAGTNGVGIVSTVSNSNGSITFNYSDGSSFTTAPLSGSNNSGQAFSNGGTLITNRNDNAVARVIISDSSDNIYVLGDSYGGGNSVTIGNTTITNTGAGNNYISYLFKINNDGTVAWLAKISNDGNALSTKKIALDNTGVYVSYVAGGSGQIAKYSLNGTLLWTINANANAVSLIIGNDSLLYALEYTGVSNLDTRIARYNRMSGTLVGFDVIASGTGDQMPIDFCIDASSNFYVALNWSGTNVFRKLSATYSLLWSKNNTSAFSNFGDLILDNSGTPFITVMSGSMTFSGVNGRYFSFNQSTGTPSVYNITGGGITDLSNALSFSQQTQKFYLVLRQFQTPIAGLQYYGNTIRQMENGSTYGNLCEFGPNPGLDIYDMIISISNNMYIIGTSYSAFLNGISGQIVIPIPGNTPICIIKTQL